VSKSCKFTSSKELDYIYNQSRADLRNLSTKIFSIWECKDKVSLTAYIKGDLTFDQDITNMYIYADKDVYYVRYRCENLYIYLRQEDCADMASNVNIRIENTYNIKNLYIVICYNWNFDDAPIDDVSINIQSPVENFYLESREVLMDDIKFTGIKPQTKKMKPFVGNTFNFYEDGEDYRTL